MHRGGWMSYLSIEEERPQVSRNLLKRVLVYAVPYRTQIIGMLVLILINTGLALLNPLLLRAIIDTAIPKANLPLLVWLSLGLLAIPAITGGTNVIQRRLNASVGEGVIYDLRSALYTHLQRMSLRFFTNTKTGELMSRLNNDVVGAQNAISNTIVGIITDGIRAAAVLTVMLLMEWRLTLVSVLILPLFIITARRLGKVLRDLTRKQLDANASMNAMMNETLNIGGALLVKLFGRAPREVQRFNERAAGVRDLGVRRAVVGSVFFVIIGLIGAVGTALVYALGGYLVIQKAFSVGNIVAFGSYLTTLYAALQSLTNAPVDFANSVVSFERVFEVIDLPLDIQENAISTTKSLSRSAQRIRPLTFS
jgi:ATP-binding cassette subfamily B protein